MIPVVQGSQGHYIRDGKQNDRRYQCLGGERSGFVFKENRFAMLQDENVY